MPPAPNAVPADKDARIADATTYRDKPLLISVCSSQKQRRKEIQQSPCHDHHPINRFSRSEFTNLNAPPTKLSSPTSPHPVPISVTPSLLHYAQTCDDLNHSPRKVSDTVRKVSDTVS